MNDPRRPVAGASASDPVVIQARLAAIVESSADAILAKDTEGIVTAWNPAAERLYGFTAGEIVGRSITAIIPPDLVDEFHYILGQVLEGHNVPAFDTHRLAKDGRRIPVSITVSPIRDATGEVVGASTVARDITDRLAIERERAWNAMLAEQSADAIVALDAGGRITMWNRASERLFGVPADEAIGQLPHLVVPSDNPEEQAAIPTTVLRDGRTLHYEAKRKHRDGSDLTIQVSVAPLHDPDGAIGGAVVSVRDVTEVRRAEHVIQEAAKREAHLERELEQTRRLESIGQLAGGVAHDFNNLLAVIMNLANLVSSGLPEGSAMRADVDEIELTAQRAANLTRQLLIFSRRDVAQVGVLDPRVVIEDLRTLLTRAAGESVELVITHSPDLWNVECDRGQLEQVVMNLVVNARDAMASGGKIVIETRNTLVDEAYAEARAGLNAGAYVTLTVSDTGCGMAPDVVEHAFEPFFTTKPPGKGTGLGLSTAYGIAQRAGGRVSIYSEPGLGTTVRVHLPATESPETAAAVAILPSPARGRGETILLVEDHPDLRRITARILDNAGYVVHAAHDGDAADRVLDGGTIIDALVTDVILPGESGVQLAARLRSARAFLPVLYTSGYSHSLLTDTQLRQRTTSFLEKPFTAHDLQAHLRALLDASR